MPKLSGWADANHENAIGARRIVPPIVCIYDLDGRVLAVNRVFERATGYSSAQCLGLDIGLLFEPRPSAPASLDVELVGKTGLRLGVALNTESLRERGRIVAVRGSGRAIDPAAFPHGGDVPELEHFSGGLQEILNLAVRRFGCADEAFAKFLALGREIFDSPAGMIFQFEEASALLSAASGTFSSEPSLRLADTPWADLANRVAPYADLNCISAPLWNGEELYGVVSFSSPVPQGRPFSALDRELVEALAQGVSVIVTAGPAPRPEPQVLEMMAARQPLENILRQIARMLASNIPGAPCSLYIVRGGRVWCAAGPGLRADFVQRFNASHQADRAPRALHFIADIATSGWFGASAEQLRGYPGCLLAPVLASDGAGLGWTAVHFGHGCAPQPGHYDLLRQTTHMAAWAIEQSRLTERLDFQATHDALTGLLNRPRFLEALAIAVEQAGRSAEILTVFFIDLDRFKHINDTLGHAAGDQVLEEAGARLGRLAAGGGLAGRVGGDEFAVVLAQRPDDTSSAQGARSLLDALRSPYTAGGQELYVTASIGVSVFPRDGVDPGALLSKADSAMYCAKKNGRNGFAAYAAGTRSPHIGRLQLETALRKALDNRELELRYQPLVGMDGKLEGLEALLHWRHPALGVIAPKDFIPLAEETGLIVPIGSWVLRQACLQGARWAAAGCRATRISVNVSALQFEREDFVDAVAAALASSGFPSSCLELELTESLVMRDVHESARRMSHLRGLGVGIAIDDFGTGYSSLSYLSILPADSLKIDQSFLRNLQLPAGSLPVVQTIVRLAHNMNLSVVAEGVETREELDLLRLAGCDKVQGHYYGCSLPEDEAAALLSRPDGLVPVALAGSA